MRTSTFQDIADCTEFRRLTHTPVPKLMHGTLLILCILIASSIAWLAFTEARIVVESQGRVRPIAGADQNWEELTTEFASETGGVVEKVHVVEGQPVKNGETLLQFNTERIENKMTQLRQETTSTELELRQLVQYQTLFEGKTRQDEARARAELDRGIAEIEKAKRLRESNIRSGKIQLTDAQDRFDRCRELHNANAVSKREFSEARTQLAAAKENLAQASLPVPEESIAVLGSTLESVIRSAQARQKEIEIQVDNKRAEVMSAQIELEALQFQHDRSTVLATADGVVTEVHVKAGDVLEPGKIGINTVQQDGLALVVNVASNDVGHLRPGMPARIKLDAYDFRDYGIVEGTVKFISPDSQLVQGPDNVQFAAYQVTIELAAIQVKRGELVGSIRLGMTAKSEIETEQQSLLTLLLRKIRGTISLT